MAMRAVANLNINLGLFGFPVKVYKATDDPTDGVGFRQLHAACKQPINQVKRCHTCNVDVQQADLLKGFEHQPGQFVTFTDAEIKALKPEAAQTVKIDGYIAADAVDPAYQDGTVYFISPDRGDKNKQPCDTFTTFRDALKGRWAIGRVVMYGREHVVVIRAVEKVLSMHFVRTVAEIRTLDDIPGYQAVPETSNREYADLMVELMNKSTVDFGDVVIEQDAYTKAVKDLVDARVAGQPDPTQTVVAPAPSAVDIMAMLKASLAAKQ